eukprot:12410467-Ditylum_brightwellii.AAC.1
MRAMELNEIGMNNVKTIHCGTCVEVLSAWRECNIASEQQLHHHHCHSHFMKTNKEESMVQMQTDDFYVDTIAISQKYHYNC